MNPVDTGFTLPGFRFPSWRKRRFASRKAARLAFPERRHCRQLQVLITLTGLLPLVRGYQLHDSPDQGVKLLTSDFPD
jgi:hypothetical protein